MKKKIFLLTTILGLLCSCQTSRIKNISFEGDIFEGELIAKNVLSVQCVFPADLEEVESSWSAASSPDGEWEKIPGIWTNEISIKVESSEQENTASAVTAQAVEFKGNPNTDWFRDAGFGVMLHYLKPAIVPDGGAYEWNEAVNSFNAEKFASQLNDAGAGFVMFTLGQNSGFYCSPNAAYDKILGTKPGELCSTRDLPMDLITELNKYDIPLILYLPGNPPVRNELVSEKFHYPLKDTATSQYNQAILESMIREWSLRYGSGVKGWWFDGLYQHNNIRGTRMDMSLKHNISTHTLAAKAGNKKSIVTYNYGFGDIQVNTPYCDYSSGEKRTIDEFPSERWVADGVQWFLFTYLGEKWGGLGQQFIRMNLLKKLSRL